MAEASEIRPPVPLETLGDVRRAMAKVCNEMRTGAIDLKLGNALMFGYSQLAHLMADMRDNKYKQRLNVLWAKHEKGTKSQPVGEQH